tara:strand:+ start:610 stop:1593 length:984 start_codon:yes stop_codon:yes gene_type:complete
MALKRIKLDLYIWEGVETGQPTTAQYVIEKSRIDTQNNILVEIGELVRDYLEVSFNDDYISETRWVRAVVELFDDDDNPFTFDNPQVFNFIATDGYGYFEDGTNPELSTNALISSNNIYLPENTAGKLPIFAEGVGKVIIDSTTTEITDNGNTNQKIQYLTIPANSSTVKVYDTDDSTLLKTITVTNLCEPKYTPYKITFINKYGAYQDLYTFKKTEENSTIKSEDFKRNTISNSSGAYQTYQGQTQRYNVNVNSSLILNTGFIKEDMNETIEELFFTENVWIRYNGQTLPVIPTSKSIKYKTVLNDKLINYSINLDFAFNKINNVR